MEAIDDFSKSSFGVVVEVEVRCQGGNKVSDGTSSPSGKKKVVSTRECGVGGEHRMWKHFLNSCIHHLLCGNLESAMYQAPRWLWEKIKKEELSI
jgi:hypothetical protein